MNRRGIWLAETTGKMIIAIICIILLIGFGFRLADIARDTQDLKAATSHMENIEKIIKELEGDGGGIREYILLNPRKWALIGWPNDLSQFDISQDVVGGDYSAKVYDSIPKICSANGWNKCLCMCEFGIGNTLEKCNKNSVCEDVSNYDAIIIGGSELIQVEKGKTLKISLENDQLEITA